MAASQSLPHLLSFQGGKLSQPLLPETSSGERGRGRNCAKLAKRIRHVHSAPTPNESCPQLNVEEFKLNENTARPKTKSHDTRRSILIGTVALVIYLGLGISCFYVMEEKVKGNRTNTFVDALYFCIVTMTTVGYGDLVPAGVAQKLLTCLYVFVGFGLVGLLFGSAANFLVERQEIMILNAVAEMEKSEDFSQITGSNEVRKIRLKVAIAGVMFLVFFALGLVVMIEVEGFTFVEAFYLVCVTVTTLGYGDVSFQTTGGRAFAVVWILLSTVNVAQLFLYIAELLTEGRRQSLLEFVLRRKTTSADLEAADMDNDGRVSASEFVIFKLKEMGKIDEQDLVEILKEFDSLDADNSGMLSTHDLKLAEATK